MMSVINVNTLNKKSLIKCFAKNYEFFSKYIIMVNKRYRGTLNFEKQKYINRRKIMVSEME